MNLPKIKSNKKERKQYVDQNPFELIAGGIKTTVVDDLGKASVNDAWDQLLLNEDKNEQHKQHNPQGGDLSAGEQLDLAEIREKAHEITEQGREFVAEIVHAGKNADSETSQETKIKIQEILIEIKSLSNSSAQLQKQVEVVSMEQMGENPGIYHLNFLEQMLSFIHDLRLNVEDSLAWFGALNSKKAARQYGAMAKKHGTSFTLNNERQVATSVG